MFLDYTDIEQFKVHNPVRAGAAELTADTPLAPMVYIYKLHCDAHYIHY